MNVIRVVITDLIKQAKDLAHQTMSAPQTDRAYLVSVGKYQALLQQASALKAKFLDPETRAAESELDLPELDEDDTITPPRRPDRVDQARRRHVPRSV